MALAKRHGVTQPAIEIELEHSEHFADALYTSYCALDLDYYEQWLSKWPLSKQVAIEHSLTHDFPAPEKVKSFVKREVNLDPPKRPRLIQGYSNLATQESFGREFTVFQKALADVAHRYEIYPGITITMASGMNGKAIADWMSASIGACSNRPHFYERDGKNWDATMQRSHHLAKLAYMRRCNPKLADFVESCFKVRGSMAGSSGFFKYKLNGTVKSGYNDTTSGNSLVNMLICAQALRAAGLRGHILVAGDDAIIVIDGDFDCQKLISIEVQFGIVPKARKLFEVSDVSFISGHWIPQPNDRFIFVPFLGRLLCKLWWTVRPPPAKQLAAYRHSIVSGIKSLVGDIPIYKEFLNIHDHVDAKTVYIRKWHYSPFSDLSQVIDLDYTTEQMCLRYGVPRAELIAFADYIGTLSGEPGFVRHPVADRIIAVDTASLEDREIAAG